MNRQGLLRLGMLACAVVLTVACGEKKPGTNHSISESKPELVTLNPVQTVAFTLRIALPPADALDKTPIPPEQPSPDDKATLDAFIKEIVKGACGAADSIAFNSEHGGPIVLSIRLFRQALRPEVSEKDIAASSDQMHNLATQTRLSSITYNAIYLEGMTAKNPTSLPQATLDWGLANGLSSTAIVNAYLNGARRTYSKVNGCRTFMVEPAAANRTNVFVEQLYEANRDFIKKLKGYDTPSPSPTKGEFETTEDFERRKTKESAEYEKHKIVLDKDRSPIAQTVVSQSLSDHLRMVCTTTADATTRPTRPTNFM